MRRKAKSKLQEEARNRLTRAGAGDRRDSAHTARLLASGAKPAEPDSRAFLQAMPTEDPVAEPFGEAFVQMATSGVDDGEYGTEQVLTEESGGPFLESSGQVEFARGTDESNPAGADRAPFPMT